MEVVMAILVVGGAGYIGSHMVASLIDSKTETVVLDNLVNGHKKAVWPGAKFYEGNMQDTQLLDKIFTENNISTVVHFAAYTVVPESVQNPAMYYDNNVIATFSLLQGMLKHGVKNIVFSSTAAVYGMPETVPVTEDFPEKPINPYGESKLAVERMLKWFGQAYDINYVVLRYFNVAGAHESGLIGECHTPETHLIPMVLHTAQGKNNQLNIYGSDYPTPDGTCIRDYVHVMDLVDAHNLCIKSLESGGKSTTYNLSSGSGFSNKEIVDAVKKVTNIDFTVNICERRPGDPPTLIASSEKIRRELSWNPTRTNIETIISTAWAWHSGKQNGAYE